MEPNERRLRLEDLELPQPSSEQVSRFARLWHERTGEMLDAGKAQDYLYRILVVTKYRQFEAENAEAEAQIPAQGLLKAMRSEQSVGVP